MLRLSIGTLFLEGFGGAEEHNYSTLRRMTTLLLRPLYDLFYARPRHTFTFCFQCQRIITIFLSTQGVYSYVLIPGILCWKHRDCKSI